MDIFNKRKLIVLQQDLDSANRGKENLREKCKRLEKQLRGDRVCDGYCKNCRHAVRNEYTFMLQGKYTDYTCELDCKCTDFKQKIEYQNLEDKDPRIVAGVAID